MISGRVAVQCPRRSTPSRCPSPRCRAGCPAALPAPLVPDAATTTTSARRGPRPTAGARVRVATSGSSRDPRFGSRPGGGPVAGELGELVAARCRLLAAVEPLPRGRVSQAEVRAAVDDHRLGRGLGQRRGDRPRLAVWQRQEDDVVTGERLHGRRLEHPLAQRYQVRLEQPSGWPALLAAVRAPISTPGWPRQQAQQLATGVPAGTGDRDGPPAHAHDYTYCTHDYETRVPRRW